MTATRTLTPVTTTPLATTPTTKQKLEQEAELEDDDDDVELEGFVLSNIGEATNRSDGTARINTGDAEAIGNDSAESTDITQSADGRHRG